MTTIEDNGDKQEPEYQETGGAAGTEPATGDVELPDEDDLEDDDGDESSGR